ncbi:S-adenosyl-L-methionine-dependent methyltransferase [Naematelia encephala]|uniref:Arginine N-methyltransferase 2 n=1 Tax=Naematelia encephala TaxID=71784 RepID=A0A1Y2ALU4_9TREE|nr:S-adenosyl-L-methionine-dependent methyltransferase [Naematelia encephala]
MAASTSSAAELPPDLLPLAYALLSASESASISSIKTLLDQGAPAWYQDDALGWSCLHYGAERRDTQILEVLLRGGAVWNAVDKWGRTAGEVCLSFGWREGWQIIRNEGVRSEDTTSAGDNLSFLKSELRWEIGDDGRERVLDADGNGVMMGWEEPLMREHVRLMLKDHPNAVEGQEGVSVLNVGYGLGIIDKLFQSYTTSPPALHTIIEAHPLVLAQMRKMGIYDWPGVRILEGRWQDFLLDGDKLGELLTSVPRGGFDVIFIDTFAEGYEDLKAFFDILPDILEPEHGVFSFWNGLGATNPTIYAVSSHLAEIHLDDVGLDVEWHDVPIPESLRSEVWKGVRRRYWDLPGYKLPIARMMLH